MLKKCQLTQTDPYLALLNIRNTPRDEVGSPAQRLFSRRTRTKLPTATQKLMPEVMKPEEVTQRLYEDRHVRAKQYYDRQTKLLKPLEKGATIRVRIGKTWQPALLLPQDTRPNTRSYPIQMPSGWVTRRNRKYLLRTKETNIYRRYDNEDSLMDKPDIPQQQVVPVATRENLQYRARRAHNQTQGLPIDTSHSSPISPHYMPRSIPGRSRISNEQPLSPVKSPLTSPASSSQVPQNKPAQKIVETTRSGRISRPPTQLSDFVK